MKEIRNQKSEIRISRRRFLAGAGRYLAAGGLLAGMGALVLKRGDECDQASACDACGQFGDCQLSQAVAARVGRATSPDQGRPRAAVLLESEVAR